jgi:hypothetical protein
MFGDWENVKTTVTLYPGFMAEIGPADWGYVYGVFYIRIPPFIWLFSPYGARIKGLCGPFRMYFSGEIDSYNVVCRCNK